MFAWGVKAKHCWSLSTNFWKKVFLNITQQCFAILPLINFPANNFNFHWRWRWLDQIFLNLFYFDIIIRIPFIDIICLPLWFQEILSPHLVCKSMKVQQISRENAEGTEFLETFGTFGSLASKHVILMIFFLNFTRK